MNKKFVTLVGVACLSAGMLWADEASPKLSQTTSNGTSKTQTKHKHTTKSSTHALNPQPLPPGRKAALCNNETMKTAGSGSGAGKVQPDLNPQPLPPGVKGPSNGGNKSMLNPQPLPPGRAQ